MSHVLAHNPDTYENLIETVSFDPGDPRARGIVSAQGLSCSSGTQARIMSAATSTSQGVVPRQPPP
jgi:hypothetical protein